MDHQIIVLRYVMITQRLDNRVKVIHKENGGLSDARNFGLEKATGDFIVFIDGDDYIELDLIKHAVKTILENDAEVAIWGYFADFVDEDEKLVNRIEKVPKAQLYDKNSESTIDISKDLVGMLGYAWNKMYKTEYLKDNSFQFTKGLSLVEDIVFNSPVLSKSNKVVFIDKAFVHYMQRPRETLGVKYYSNYFELKKKALYSIDHLLYAWNIGEHKRKTIISEIGFNNLKSTFKSINNSDKTNKEKLTLMQKVRVDKASKDILKDFKPYSVKNWLIYIFN